MGSSAENRPRFWSSGRSSKFAQINVTAGLAQKSGPIWLSLMAIGQIFGIWTAVGHEMRSLQDLITIHSVKARFASMLVPASNAGSRFRSALSAQKQVR